jgi:hypothetical protein
VYVISEKSSERRISPCRFRVERACCKPEATLSGVDYSMYGSHKVRCPTAPPGITSAKGKGKQRRIRVRVSSSDGANLARVHLKYQ